MGFCRLTCAVCKGEGNTIAETVCSNCNGEGTIITHTGAIGSCLISTDPADKGKDETWAILWKRHDDGELEILDSAPVPRSVS